MSFLSPKVAKPVPAATAPVAAIPDQVTTEPMGVDSFISSGTATNVPKRKANTTKPSLIGGSV